MTTPNALGYAFALSLPPAEDLRLRRWAEEKPGATWDPAGGHVTLARFTGVLPPERLVVAMHAACSGMGPIATSLTLTSREAYWDKPGSEIVMLVGERGEDVAGVLQLRERLLASMLAEGLSLLEGGPYRPHVTLTTGLPPHEARRLEALARDLDLRFTAREVVFWSGGELSSDGAEAQPPWHVVERLPLI